MLIAGHTSVDGNQICLVGRPHILPCLVHTVVDPAAVKQAQHIDVAHRGTGTEAVFDVE